MAIQNCFNDDNDYQFTTIVDGLNRHLRLKATPVGMKRFKTVSEMEAVPRIRRPDPNEKMAMDQIVGQSRWIGYTLGVTMENLMGAQCGATYSSYAHLAQGVRYSLHLYRVFVARAFRRRGMSSSPNAPLPISDISLLAPVPSQ